MGQLNSNPTGLLGLRIVRVRPMNSGEAKRMGWSLDAHTPVPCLLLSDGSILYPARDPELNGAGTLVIYNKEKNEISTIGTNGTAG